MFLQNNAEIEIKRQVKLFKGFKIFLYTSDIQMQDGERLF